MATLAVPPRTTATASAGADRERVIFTGTPERLTWADCGDGFECGTLAVPLDYDDPSGRYIKLALIRLPSLSPVPPYGSLVVNPGGPGGSGLEFLRGFADDFSDRVRRGFHLVSFDPRGVGESAHFSCGDLNDLSLNTDATPDDDAGWQDYFAMVREMSKRCEAVSGELIPHLGTRDVARDLDRIRAALGQPEITYLGFSYGTEIGAVYADLFPDRIRAMVLDGAVDVTVPVEDALAGRAAGQESALREFLWACEAAPAGKFCRDRDGEDALDALLIRAREEPIPAFGADRDADENTILAFLSWGASRKAYVTLDRALTEARDGDATTLVKKLDEFAERNADGSYPDDRLIHTAVTCLDRSGPAVEDVPAIAERMSSVSRHFGTIIATDLADCGWWPAPPDPLTEPRGAGAPPIIVVGTTGDPVTPYEWSEALAEQLESAVLVTAGGETHTSYLWDRCVSSVVDEYLTSLDAPARDVDCRR